MNIRSYLSTLIRRTSECFGLGFGHSCAGNSKDQPTPDPMNSILDSKTYTNMALTLPKTEDRRKTRLHEFLMEDIREDLLLECELLILSFATGIQDAAAWPDYSCFASNQTGNTLFLAIGVAGLTRNAYSFPNIGVSLSLFVAGGFIMGQLGNYIGVRRRLWLLISNLIQTLFVFCALFIQHQWPVKRDGPAAMAVIALLAFSSGAQVAMSRSLKITEITTAMATAAFIDLVVDPDLGKLKNRLRNRRVMFLIMLVAGCFVGAFAQREINSKFPLLLCALGKALVSMAMLFNRPIERTRSSSSSTERLKV